MSKVIEQPQQYKQPSRKGKKAWRKNVDITEVSEGLRVVREEETRGGVVAEKPSEELFTLDVTGDPEVEKTSRKKRKPLRADEILAQRSAIPAVDSRKRANPKVTDGIIEPKTKKQRSDWVSNKEWDRLRQVAKDNKPVAKQDGEIHDPWGDSPEVSNTDNSKFSFLPKTKAKVAPVTLKAAPISLAANGKRIPAVKKPEGGTSYNPSFEEWDSLLVAEGAREVEAEKKRIEEAEKEAERQRLIEEAQGDDGQVKSDDESAWEGFESEYEKPEWLNKKRPERKTQAQRNKIKRRKEAERKARWEAKMKQKEEQAQQIKDIANRVEEQEEIRKQLQINNDSSDEGDDTVLRRRPLGGKNFAPEKPLEVVLPDELQDSLRLLKPEGNLLDDRFRTLIVQGKLESRKPVSQPKKAKRKLTEKWSHKDFQTTEIQSQNGLKRKRSANTSVDKKADRPRKFLKPRRMAEVVGDERVKTPSSSRRSSTTGKEVQRIGQVNEGLSPTAEIGKYVAIDCEMVGVGPNPDKESALARVSIVNWNGDQVYDSFVRPKEMVTDWRTHVSGIEPKHMIDARSFEEVQKDVVKILEGTILVGHAVRNDLKALIYSHPMRDIRDTSKYPAYRKIAGGGSPSLKLLAAQLLGLKIQEGSHSSVEDARATMLLFRRVKQKFEEEHAKKWPARVVPIITAGDDDDASKAKKKKKTKKKSRKR
ncbi:RNA exonuclease 4 [Talaromyces islandicus]|uniref:RNA exonuclease 4 n=1 Tax=Talaromyces islandicus TaxID=28573 RepID=A0A0U1M6B4_TALIS|nr:RNA exonuclease 4 [Talaromyces islandicus]